MPARELNDLRMGRSLVVARIEMQHASFSMSGPISWRSHNRIEDTLPSTKSIWVFVSPIMSAKPDGRRGV